MQVQVSYNKKEAKTYNASRTTTVKELIDMVKADYNVPNANISAVLNGFKLKPSEKLSQISLKEGNIIQMYVEAAASAQPVRKRLCIPRRTDIDAEMKAPPDLEIYFIIISSKNLNRLPILSKSFYYNIKRAGFPVLRKTNLPDGLDIFAKFSPEDLAKPTGRQPLAPRAAF